MATRYSGDVKVNITYDDRRAQYKASVSEKGQHRWSGYVRPPPAQRIAVDSAEAYDDAAGAALSFAMDAVHDLSGSVHWGSGTRPMLSRSAPKGRSSSRASRSANRSGTKKNTKRPSRAKSSSRSGSRKKSSCGCGG